MPQNACNISQSIFEKNTLKTVYRDYKNFSQNEFLHEFDLEINKGKFYNSDKPYDDFSNLLKQLLINMLKQNKRK